jgi:hypothetical protein
VAIVGQSKITFLKACRRLQIIGRDVFSSVATNERAVQTHALGQFSQIKQFHTVPNCPFDNLGPMMCPNKEIQKPINCQC